MTEEWKDIVGYEGLYQVSNLGRVKSLERMREFKNRWGGITLTPQPETILVQCMSTNGYLHVTLCKNRTRTNKAVHRLVADAFIPNPENKPCIDHINRVKTMNSVDNLRWVSAKENIDNRDIDMAAAVGKHIIQYDLNGNFITEFNTLEEAGRKFGCSEHIRNCAKHRRETAYGYKWEYKEKGGE